MNTAGSVDPDPGPETPNQSPENEKKRNNFHVLKSSLEGRKLLLELRFLS
jgi:hypothetical protein